MNLWGLRHHPPTLSYVAPKTASSVIPSVARNLVFEIAALLARNDIFMPLCADLLGCGLHIILDITCIDLSSLIVTYVIILLMSKESFPYDRTVRELMLHIPKRFIELFFGVSVVEVLDPNFPKTEERRADFVGRLSDKRIVHVEVQAQYDSSLPERMVEYYLRLKGRYDVIPMQVLLWLGDGASPYDGELEVGEELRFRYRVQDIKEIDCRELLRSEDPNDYILAVLCRRSEGFWEALKERLLRIEESRRVDYIQKLIYMVKLRQDTYEDYKALIEEVRVMPLPVFDKKTDPWYLEGMEKGLVLDAQELVIEALEERFGYVDELLKGEIKAIQSREVLKRLHRLAVRAQSLEAFWAEYSRLN